MEPDSSEFSNGHKMPIETLTLVKINACQSLNNSRYTNAVNNVEVDIVNLPGTFRGLSIHSKMNTLIPCTLGPHTYHSNTFIVP